MRDTERDAETQAEGEAGSVEGAPCRSRSRVSRTVPWAEGRCLTAEPSRDPHGTPFSLSSIYLSIYLSTYLPINQSSFFFKDLFIHDRQRERERERQRHRRREKQAPCREPDAGLDPGTPGSHSGLKVVLNC